MKRTILITLVICLTASLLRAQVNGLNKDWPHWRGPMGTGVAPAGNPPVEFSETKNLKWKLDIPGKGHATPIIWENQMIILTAVPTEKEGKVEATEAAAPQHGGRGGGWMRSHKTTKVYEYLVMLINPDNGKVIWKTRVYEERPEESTHELGSWASASPLTDGKYIYAYFGSRGLFCLDMKGKLIWKRDFGQMSKRMSFGEGSSPGLSNDKIFVIWDHEGDSFLYAIDKRTGKDVWKKAREERTSWSSPKVIKVNGREQVIISATGAIRGYDSETGEVIWHCTGLTHNVIPYPVVHNDVVFLMSGFRGNALFAVDLKRAKGDINGTDMIVWSHDKDTPYTPSPLLWDGYIYFLKANNGILSCFNAETFEEMYSKQRLEGIGNIYTSPVGANDQFYIVGQKGKVFVVKKGPEFEILAVNELKGEYCSSPAIVGDRIYIRSYETLYCFEK